MDLDRISVRLLSRRQAAHSRNGSGRDKGNCSGDRCTVCEAVSKVVDRPMGWIAMLTRNTKRLVLGIVSSAREVSDVWKKAPGIRKNVELAKAMDRLEQAVDRLDRIENARSKVD